MNVIRCPDLFDTLTAKQKLVTVAFLALLFDANEFEREFVTPYRRLNLGT